MPIQTVSVLSIRICASPGPELSSNNDEEPEQSNAARHGQSLCWSRSLKLEVGPEGAQIPACRFTVCTSLFKPIVAQWLTTPSSWCHSLD